MNSARTPRNVMPSWLDFENMKMAAIKLMDQKTLIRNWIGQDFTKKERAITKWRPNKLWWFVVPLGFATSVNVVIYSHSSCVRQPDVACFIISSRAIEQASKQSLPTFPSSPGKRTRLRDWPQFISIVLAFKIALVSLAAPFVADFAATLRNISQSSKTSDMWSNQC